MIYRIPDDLPDCPDCGEPIRSATRVGSQALVGPCDCLIPARHLRPAHVDDSLQEALVADGGSKYINETGDGYVGTFAVRRMSCEVNMVTVGIERGTDLAIIADGEGVARITTCGPGVDDPLQTSTVNSEGYLSVWRPVQEHLGVSDGDDIRMYEREHGYALVNADDDPFVSADGGDQP